MTLHVEGLDELISRMQRYPGKVRKSLRTTLEYALLVLQESVPSYPSPPAGSTYQRTGTLGCTLTIGDEDNIYEIRDGGDYMAGEFGTNLEYAPFVIGDPESQQAAHMKHWWTLPVTVVNRALGKITGGFQALADELADFLAGKGD